MFSKDAFRLIVFSLLFIGLAEGLSSSSKNSSSGRSGVKNKAENEFHQSLNGGFTDSAQPKAQKIKGNAQEMAFHQSLNGGFSDSAHLKESAKEMEFRRSLNGGLSNLAEPKVQKVKDSSSRKSKGFGLSAWALIGLILSVILCGVFLYYATIFYPILCKKERKYDVMEVSATP